MRAFPRLAAAGLSVALVSVTALLSAPLATATDSADSASWPVQQIRPGGSIDDENCSEHTSDGTLQTEMLDLPDPVVRGEWNEFTYRVTNTYDHPLPRVYPHVQVFAYDGTGEMFEVRTEWYSQGSWVDAGGETWGEYFGVTGPLLPGQSAEARMRMRLDEFEHPELIGGSGRQVTWAWQGTCESSLDDQEFSVEKIYLPVTRD